MKLGEPILGYSEVGFCPPPIRTGQTIDDLLGLVAGGFRPGCVQQGYRPDGADV
jgi:hypothetical protein